MTIRARTKRLVRLARMMLFPEPEQLDPAIRTAEANAEGWWRDVFQPLGAEIADADILEFGCRDGRLLGLLLERGARSATGVETTPLWDGSGAAPAWDRAPGRSALQLLAGSDQLNVLDPQSFDVILCRGFDRQAPISLAEATLRRLYALLRPGGEMLIRVRCADADSAGLEGAGYGMMTPTSWALMFRATGFEVDQTKRIWGDDDRQARIASIVPQASEDERLCSELHCRLIRPWELAEIEALTARRRRRR